MSRAFRVLAAVLASSAALAVAPAASGAAPEPVPASSAQGPPAAVSAIQPAAPPSSGSLPQPPPPPAAHGPFASSVPLTPEQIATFANVVDDSEMRITDRLARDPDLAPLALRAVEARSHRKAVGGVLAGIGIAIFVVGDIAGAVVIATTPGYPAHVQDTSQVLGGLLVSLVSFGVGAALAVPGFIKVGKSSDEEKKAADYYKEERRDGLLAPPSPLLRGAVRMPLVSLSF